MRKQFVVIGLGRFGSSVARTLMKLGHEVLALDKNEQAVQGLMHDVTQAVQADAREEETLRALGVRNLDVGIVGIGDDLEANILITLMLKEMGVPYVVAKAQSIQHGKVLEKIGADKIVYPEQDMGIRLANNLSRTNVMDFIELSLDYSIFEIIAPSQFVNKTLGKLNLRAVYNVNVVAIKKNADQIVIAPGANSVVEEKDILVIVCNKKALSRLPD
ncbi:K+ transport system, NAD-binding component [Desulfosporosinus orientis DSM 765]|uniref:K+ transport system, NAD-binding component n=1 Tax=Desulfosporosinus orientis (strain ATCC 19365 / DSM 765 / NCIMB 8382 / VKM B-1628 / Singapore I) TaxID=768706 RepID=G7W7P8_DESOD|nr:TrkA family potassium uptake protein [Desulfosporosinus orientis]AET66113.1 K+ transport system, NAD-binding component [Desulfosporosinus orientis DSM 765]